MERKARFAEYTAPNQPPVLILAEMLDLGGATVYVVSEDGIHEGTFVRLDEEEIVFVDEQANTEAKVHARKVHLFLRDAEHHFRVLSKETNWGARAGD